MTQTRKEALTDLLAKVKAGDEFCIERAIQDAFGGYRTSGVSLHARGAFNGDPKSAIAVVKAALPGWGWRMAECHVSDDAWVFPDFKCPEHGPRLRATLDESMDLDWCGLTDVDQRPPGNPARALFRSALIALISQEPGQ